MLEEDNIILRRFNSGSNLSFSSKLVLVSYRVEDELTLHGNGTVNGTAYTVSSPVILKSKESGTAPTVGATINYVPSGNFEFRFDVDYLSGVGGGNLIEADLTICNIGVSARF